MSEEIAPPEENGTAKSNGAVNGSAEEETHQEKENSILRLFQFYLGDSNLPFDRFLFGLSQHRLASEEQTSKPGTGWIDIAKIATFKRMAPYQDFSTAQIADILRKSAGPAIEVDEKGERMRRKDPISIERSSGQVDRSLYAKGFPAEEDEHLQLRIERFFQRHHQTNAVRMRREGDPSGRKTPKGKFKGSVFVEFADKADRDAFLALDPKPTFPGQEAALEMMAKREYLDMKAEEHHVQASYKDTPRNFSAFRELKEQAKSPSRRRTIDYRGAELDIENGKIRDPEAIPSKDDDHEHLLRFTNSLETDFATLKEALGKVSKVAFIEISKDPEAAQYVCFEKPISDADFDAIVKANLEGTDKKKYEWHRASKEDAKDYHKRRASFHARRADHVSSERARDSGYSPRGGRGGRGGGRGGGSSGRDGRKHDSKPYDRKGGGRSRRDEGEKSKAEKTADGLSVKAEPPSDEVKGDAPKRKAEDEAPGSVEVEAKKVKTEPKIEGDA